MSRRDDGRNQVEVCRVKVLLAPGKLRNDPVHKRLKRSTVSDRKGMSIEMIFQVALTFRCCAPVPAISLQKDTFCFDPHCRTRILLSKLRVFCALHLCGKRTKPQVACTSPPETASGDSHSFPLSTEKLHCLSNVQQPQEVSDTAASAPLPPPSCRRCAMLLNAARTRSAHSRESFAISSSSRASSCSL